MTIEAARLIQPFYDVMHKYRKHFSEVGVRTNLTAWCDSKMTLLSLLRKHPNWSEAALAVIIPITERRSIDSNQVIEHRRSLVQIARTAGLDQSRYGNFSGALLAATDEFCASPSEAQIETIKALGGIACVTGQKSSRIVAKLCNAFGINKIEGYEKVFAKLADALNPLEVSRQAVLSIHPCDYLEMSNKDNSWHSCHSLDGGGHQAGCMSYLIDGVTMIFYTVDGTVSSDYHKALKRARQVFCYNDGLLLQSRLYPDDANSDAINRYRRLVQDILTDCIGAENRWDAIEDGKDLLLTVPGSKQYPDYKDYQTVCALEGIYNHGKLLIGAPPICVCCGSTTNNSGRLKCGCIDYIVCDECDETVHLSGAQYHEGKWVCNSCLHTCESCGCTSRGKLLIAYNGHGGAIYICNDCNEQRRGFCASCSVYGFCSQVDGSRFCSAVASTRAAA